MISNQISPNNTTLSLMSQAGVASALTNNPLNTDVIDNVALRSSVDVNQTAIKLDTAGNTFSDARRINISSQGRAYSEQIGGFDPVDFFSFSLGAKK